MSTHSFSAADSFFGVAPLGSAAVGLALITGRRQVLRQCNRPFRELFGFWSLGQDAGVALSAAKFRPLLRALDLPGKEHSSVLVDLAVRTGSGRVVHRTCLVAAVPVTSRFGLAVLLVAGPLGSRRLSTSAAAVEEGVTDVAGRALARYEALLSAIPHVVWLMTPEGKVATLVGRLGVAGESLWQPEAGSSASWMDAVHPKDRIWFASQWRATRRGKALLDAMIRVRVGDDSGRYRHVKIIAVPVLRDGEVVEWVGMVSDAEEEWREQMKERLLARVAAIPTAGTVPDVFSRLARAVVPDLFDALAVFHPQAGTRHGLSGMEHTMARAQAALAPGLPALGSLPDDFALGRQAERAIATRKSLLITFPAGQPPADLLSGVSRAWMEQAGATSLLVAPLVADERVVALVAASTCQGHPPPSGSDLDLFNEILRRVQDPVQRTLELQGARETALTLQRSFLLPPPSVEGAELAAAYQPADSSAEIGGDWYDAVRTRDGSVSLSIGDVAGHDLMAATAMGKISNMLRGFAYDAGWAGPAATLARLDLVAQGLDIAPLITAVHVVLRPVGDGSWQATLSNAGHPPPLLVPGLGTPRFLGRRQGTDPPLCVLPEVSRTESHYRIEPGDTLVLYTDGLIENPRRDIGDGLALLIRHAATLRSRALVADRFVAELLRLPEDRRDDVAVIAFRVPTGERRC
ncbi:SpoIIE family protein phosphatase [Streptomyces sp. ITFR-6]|uniref:SpoIIE family protein phosphatase n=1 Tax=Streptomyces sp. ITFR-6 TaxID=3075197 RepID=UPI00288BC4D9|nr:SpoIIE family protein phosphatase [Streptomyces sp. ITFR-6]WNI27783.1 SpoIIE family protein phosphatase [Streptomyces sp. ITFR-6]